MARVGILAVEYARKSATRDDAPTLVPVDQRSGNPVKASLLILRPDASLQEAKDQLYRRETNRVGNMAIVYDDAHQRQRRQQGHDAVLIEDLGEPLGGAETVIFASLQANIPIILRGDESDEAKAQALAQLATSSVTQNTFPKRRDGIAYLEDAIAAGIRTRLTDAYKNAILRVTDSPNLGEARKRIAQSKGLF